MDKASKTLSKIAARHNHWTKKPQRHKKIALLSAPAFETTNCQDLDCDPKHSFLDQKPTSGTLPYSSHRHVATEMASANFQIFDHKR